MRSRLQRYFVSGIIIFLPLALTINLFFLTISLADGLLGRYIEPYFSREFGFYFRGVSISISILLIFLIGFFAHHLFGHKIIPYFERLLLRLPFFKQVYPALKELSLFLFSREHQKITFERVVLVEYPRKGIYTIAFWTNDSPRKISEKVGEELCNIFVPSTPSPLTGFFILVPKKDLIFPDISVEEAVKIVMSGGVVKSQ